MTAIFALLTTSLGKFLLKLMLSTTSEKFVEWAFFKIAEELVSYTKTPVDDEWLAEIKANFQDYENKPKAIDAAQQVVDAVK